MKDLPKTINPGWYGSGHVQGVAVDLKRGFAYFSFTTKLIKTELSGKPVGSVVNLTGHLGCISLSDDGGVIGSLEYKSDSIGKSIAGRNGTEIPKENAFYLVKFDTEKITRPDMDAETDGVMLAVFLPEPTRDYAARDEASGKEHRYGCSGIDGTGIGELFGAERGSAKFVTTCYGVYSDRERHDNDYQVLLSYPLDIFEKYGKPLSQSALHKSGPPAAYARHFLYTGNTAWGVQNLEYDEESGLWFVCVYNGTKECFSNFSLFTVNGAEPPIKGELEGRGGERGSVIRTAGGEPCKSGKCSGYSFSYGSTGIASVGGGYFYVSEPKKSPDGKSFSTDLTLYKHVPSSGVLFEKV